MRDAIGKLCLAVICGLTATSVANAAGLHFLNKSAEKISVAVATYSPASGGYIGNGYSFGVTDPAGWSIDGWYIVAPGERVTVREKIHGREFYYFAKSETGKLWSGRQSFLADPKNKFQVFYDSESRKYRNPAAGLASFGFARGNTGGFRDYAVTLSINGQQVASGPIQKITRSFAFRAKALGTTLVQHPFEIPAGATLVSYTRRIFSSRGDRVRWIQTPRGILLSGSVSGEGKPFGAGGVYKGEMTLYYRF